MIFTLAHREGTLERIAAQPGRATKQGPSGTFRGGIAFPTAVDALAWSAGHQRALAAVFALRGDWPADVAWDALSGFHRITRDLIFVGLA